MVGTAHAQWARLARSGLWATSTLYPMEPDGRRVFRGERPGADWVGHGTFPRNLTTLLGGDLIEITVHKQRWRRRGTNETRHSHPPDDLASVRFCSLIVATMLWGWLSSDEGLHRHGVALPALEARPSRRTVQRWLRRALPHADETSTALRRAAIERSEPRPMESHVGGGLSPPSRRWGDPNAVFTLRSGLRHLYEGTVALDVHVSVLLAEARGRQHVRTAWLI